MKKFVFSLWLGLNRNPLRQKGASMIEYALIAGLISVVAITALTSIGDDLKILFEDILDAID